MAQLVWTEPALIDLDEIAEYIALDDPQAARELVKQVFSSVERLETHPKSGRKPPELKGLRYRELVVGPCRIFYREDGKKIFILYVMRSERTLRQFILSSRSDNDS